MPKKEITIYKLKFIKNIIKYFMFFILLLELANSKRLIIDIFYYSF